MFLTFIIGRLYNKNLHHLAMILENHVHRSCLWESECKNPVVVLIHACLWKDFLTIATYHIEIT